jgi:hypothetical protein
VNGGIEPSDYSVFGPDIKFSNKKRLSYATKSHPLGILYIYNKIKNAITSPK